jgi:aldose 1-epimerase
MSMRVFGMTADGHPIHAALIRWPGGLEAEVLEFGAILHRLRSPAADGLRDVILGLDSLEAYETDTAYIGALVGRVANRIDHGRFLLDGREVQVSVNEPPNTLHGGVRGFNRCVWKIMAGAGDERSVTLELQSPHGDQGFPGGMTVRARFTLVAADTLEIAYEGETDAPTAVNLSQHLYFNLLGNPNSTILDHRLTVAASRYTPVGPGLIPTGELATVEGGPLDLRSGPAIREVLAQSDPQLTLGGGIDLNWALDRDAAPNLRLVAPDGVWLELTTDQAGVQIYSGHKLAAPFVPYGALAIEPQGFPDAVNHPDFPSIVLRPGRVYRHVSRYRFGT